MKKFSKITDYKITSKPKKEKIEESIEDIIKSKLLSLMDRNLRIQSYGSVDNRYLSGSVKVEGKELLAESIMDLIAELSSNKEIKTLESLKSNIKEWYIIDEKIDEIKKNKSNYKQRFKLNNIIKRYKYNDELLVDFLKEKINKSNKKDDLINEIKNNKNLSDNIKKNILD
jgi:hypothetical protein